MLQAFKTGKKFIFVDFSEMFSNQISTTVAGLSCKGTDFDCL